MMRRTPLKSGGPLKSNGFARADRKEAQAVGRIRKAAPARKATLKAKGPRMTPIRRAARGQDCTLQLDGICNRDPATTVLCHSNYLADGKGMGLKAPDTAAAFGCALCHDVLDGRRPRPEGWSRLDLEGAFYAAVKRTHQILARMGLIKSEATNGLQPAVASIKTPEEVYE